MTFKDLRLAEPIVRAVTDHGYAIPTPIQSEAIPAILSGRDVLGCAQTGTGKTAAFALPVIHHLSKTRNQARGRTPRALILCPTRELASQILQSFRTYARHLPLRGADVVGGVSQYRQVKDLRAGVDVLIATPGRLLDLMNQGLVDLRAVEILVLDEADRMLDMGFIRDIRKIIAEVPQKRQTLLFSATMPAEIREFAKAILHDAVRVQSEMAGSTAERICQSLYKVDKADKRALLEKLLRGGTMERTLVFTRTKHGADRLAKVLCRGGIEAGAIHGNKSQGARTRALDGFKSGRTPVLVATDVAARGIDVDGITHVVNFDVPNEPDTYVHRIGRTARAGAAGTAITFCDRAERKELRAIEGLLGEKLAVMQGLDVSETDGQAKIDKALPGTERRRNQKTRRRTGQATSGKPRRASGSTSQRGRGRMKLSDLPAGSSPTSRRARKSQ